MPGNIATLEGGAQGAREAAVNKAPVKVDVSVGPKSQAETGLLKVIDQGRVVDNPDAAFAALAGNPPEKPPTVPIEVAERPDFSQQAASEQAYIARTAEKYKGLDIRYADERTSAANVQKQIDDFAAERGLQHEQVDALVGKKFDAEARKVIGERLQAQIDVLFNSEKGSRSPEKHKSVTEQAQHYMDLMLQAQQEGNISAELNAQVAMQHLENNVWSLAFQDRVAAENMLGDHGVRHLVDHNIKVGEALFDAINEHNPADKQVKAIDKLMLHQVMIDHDMGYAMSPVREPIAAGQFGADGGHNVLAAKFVRERAQANAILAQVFTEQQMNMIHQGILEHDSREVNIHIGDTSDQARADNLYSIIHTADNTHAFEDKLPELLYGYPDSLKTMRLMKTAGEIGDAGMVDSLKNQLIADIQANSNFSDQDKQALTNAARYLGPKSYEKSMPRIAGKKPEVAMKANGDVTITVTESATHSEVVGLFNQTAYEQFIKFIGDTTGVKKVNVGETNEVTSPEGKVTVKLKVGSERATEKTDYQQAIENIIQEPAFSEFAIKDSQMSADQRFNQEQAEQATNDSDRVKYEGRVAKIKALRKTNVDTYIVANAQNMQVPEQRSEV